MKIYRVVLIFTLFSFHDVLFANQFSTSHKKCVELKVVAEENVSAVFSGFIESGKLTQKIKDNLILQTPKLYAQYAELKSCFNQLFFSANSDHEHELIKNDRQWVHDFGGLAIFLEVLDSENQCEKCGPEENMINKYLKELLSNTELQQLTRSSNGQNMPSSFLQKHAKKLPPNLAV